MNTDNILTILQKTHDGDDLSPQHLKLVELGINGYLNKAGLAVLDELYESVAAGTYQKPYHLGVGHMTLDHEGYVYFKDIQVEHYTSPWAYSLDAKASLIKLQHQCLFLENINVQSSLPYMLCDYKMKGQYGEAFCKEEKQKLDWLCKENSIRFSQVQFAAGGITEGFLMPGHIFPQDVVTSEQYQDLLQRENIQTRTPAIITALSYGSGNGREATEQELNYLNCCMEYLSDHNWLNIHSKVECPLLPDQSADNCEDYER